MRRSSTRPRIAELRQGTVRGGRGVHLGAGLLAGFDHEGGRRLLAAPEARAGLLAGADGGAVDLARDVHAAMNRRAGSILEREEVVEAGYAEDLGRGDVQGHREMVDGARADPSDPVVDGVQQRQQLVPSGPVDGDVGIDGRSLRHRWLPRRTASGPSGRHQFVDTHGGGLELGGARTGVVGLDGEQVDVDLLGEVERHEDQPGAHVPVDTHRRLDRSARRGDPHDLAVGHADGGGVGGRHVDRLAPAQR